LSRQTHLPSHRGRRLGSQLPRHMYRLVGCKLRSSARSVGAAAVGVPFAHDAADCTADVQQTAEAVASILLESRIPGQSCRATEPAGPWRCLEEDQAGEAQPCPPVSRLSQDIEAAAEEIVSGRSSVHSSDGCRSPCSASVVAAGPDMAARHVDGLPDTCWARRPLARGDI
jgi:hypothetical protein